MAALAAKGLGASSAFACNGSDQAYLPGATYYLEDSDNGGQTQFDVTCGHLNILADSQATYMAAVYYDGSQWVFSAETGTCAGTGGLLALKGSWQPSPYFITGLNTAGVPVKAFQCSTDNAPPQNGKVAFK